MQTPLSILVADDDVEDLELIEDAFARVEPNIDLHKVTNGKAVIEYLANQTEDRLPCLIVLDFNMPELTGSKVLFLICQDKRYAAIPKVILSTSSTPLHIQECMRNGATEYFVKPHSMRDLIDLAKKMLDYCKNPTS